MKPGLYHATQTLTMEPIICDTDSTASPSPGPQGHPLPANVAAAGEGVGAGVSDYDPADEVGKVLVREDKVGDRGTNEPTVYGTD